VLHALRDVREVDPHEGRDRLNVAEPIPTIPATTAAPITIELGDPSYQRLSRCTAIALQQLSADSYRTALQSWWSVKRDFKLKQAQPC
jgi:hypothetical protein